LRGRTDLPDAGTHDLRRTLATGLGNLGIPDEIIERVLIHAPRTITGKHYNHAKYFEPMRRALEASGERIEAIMALVWLAIVVWAPWIFHSGPVFYGVVQAIPTVAITVLLADLTYRHVELPWNAVGQEISHAMVTKRPPTNDAGFDRMRAAEVQRPVFRAKTSTCSPARGP
jgi:hypothetical protein